PLHQTETVVLVVDGKVTAEAEQLGLTPQQPGGERMEGANPEARRVALEQPPDALLHLARGLVGECDREDTLRWNAMALDQGGDSRGKDASLARSCASEHQHRAMHVLHRLLLGRVERVRQLW